MKSLLIKLTGSKTSDTYKENIELTFKTSRSLVQRTHHSLALLEQVPKAENWQAIRTNDILKDEAAKTFQRAAGMREVIKSDAFESAVLEAWNLNELALKSNHGLAVEDITKHQYYNTLKRAVSSLDNIEAISDFKESNFDISESLLFAQKSLIQIHYDIEHFKENVDFPNGIGFSIMKAFNAIQDNVIPLNKLEEQKNYSQKVWKNRVRSPQNFSRYIK